MMATDQKKRTLDALERRFALAKSEIQQQQEKSKKRLCEQYQKQNVGQSKQNASSVASQEENFKTPFSKKAHTFFTGHEPSCEPSGRSGSSNYKGKKDVDANDCTYTQISEPIHENLINAGIQPVQLPNNQMVDKVLHELFQNGDDAVRYANGSHNKKIECWFQLDVYAPKRPASSVAHAKALKSHAKRCKRHMSMKQHKKCGSFDLPQEFHKFDIFEPMHEMWKDYILKLIKNIGDIQTIAQRLLSADLHGAILQVVECKVTSFSGVSGIMVRETAKTFGIITCDNNFRVVPKRASIFILRADCWKITLRGDELISRKYGS